MKVLIAVLSSRLDPWWPMIATSKETWDSVEVPDTETVYYVGEPASPLQDRIVGFAVPEGYKNLGHRNLAFFEWALQREWDFMARVNASCFVHKERLKAWCATASPTGLFAGGGKVRVLSKVEYPWMWGGHQFVLSRDVVSAMLANAGKWDHTKMDDVALSAMAVDLGIPFTEGLPSASIDRPPEGWRAVSAVKGNSRLLHTWDDLRYLDTEFFFRVKQDLKRHLDAEIMRKLHEHYQHGTGQEEAV